MIVNGEHIKIRLMLHRGWLVIYGDGSYLFQGCGKAF